MAKAKKKKTFDYGLLLVVIVLIVVGLFVLYSTSSYNGRVKFQDEFYYFKKQFFATALGVLCMYMVSKIDYHVWKKYAIFMYVISLALSLAVIFIGDEYNGSKRWLSFGPISFQPSEYAKLAVILFLAKVIEQCDKKAHR